MALMGARLEAHVEHKLKARIYLHERIVEVLARKIPHRHPEMTNVSSGYQILPMLTCLGFQTTPDRLLGEWPRTTTTRSR